MSCKRHDIALNTWRIYNDNSGCYVYYWLYNIIYLSIQDGGVAPGSEAYRELLNKEQEMEKKMIKMSEENIELRFEVEQAKKDNPRLKVSNLN